MTTHAMTAESARLLKQTERAMEADQLEFHQVGASLAKLGEARIRAYLRFSRGLNTVYEGKLWRGKYESFEDYCERRWGIDHSHGYRRLIHLEVADRVSPNGETIPTEAQAREIDKFPVDEQPAVWKKLTANGHAPTAREIAELEAESGVAVPDDEEADFGEQSPEQQQAETEAAEAQSAAERAAEEFAENLAETKRFLGRALAACDRLGRRGAAAGALIGQALKAAGRIKAAR